MGAVHVTAGCDCLAGWQRFAIPTAVCKEDVLDGGVVVILRTSRSVLVTVCPYEMDRLLLYTEAWNFLLGLVTVRELGDFLVHGDESVEKVEAAKLDDWSVVLQYSLVYLGIFQDLMVRQIVIIGVDFVCQAKFVVGRIFAHTIDAVVSE